MSQATAEPQNVASRAKDDDLDLGPCCERCGFLTKSAACPACGWYPSLGIYVEIDPQFEAMNGVNVPLPEGAPAPAEGLAKHLAVWKGLIPVWGWVLLGTTLACVAGCIAARVATDATPYVRSVWGVSMLLGGMGTALVAHITCFVLMSADDADLGLADILVKPLKAWGKLLTQLPQRVTVLNVANAGVTSALGAALIVGGIPYESLLDWGFKARAKPNLVGMIAEQAQKIEGKDESLEDSVNDFANKAAGDLTADKPRVEKPRTNLDCVVIGFLAGAHPETGEKRIEALLIAGDNRGKLKHLGSVRPVLDAKDAKDMLSKFERYKSSRPFVQTSITAQWVQPRFTCRVSYTDWAEGGKPKDLKWVSLLEEVQLPW
ncbi:MAG: hypothetical protein ACRCT8_00905 [Lacipirellulaceae bacterium]